MSKSNHAIGHPSHAPALATSSTHWGITIGTSSGIAGHKGGEGGRCHQGGPYAWLGCAMKQTNNYYACTLYNMYMYMHRYWISNKGYNFPRATNIPPFTIMVKKYMYVLVSMFLAFCFNEDWWTLWVRLSLVWHVLLCRRQGSGKQLWLTTNTV